MRFGATAPRDPSRKAAPRRAFPAARDQGGGPTFAGVSRLAPVNRILSFGGGHRDRFPPRPTFALDQRATRARRIRRSGRNGPGEKLAGTRAHTPALASASRVRLRERAGAPRVIASRSSRPLRRLRAQYVDIRRTFP